MKTIFVCMKHFYKFIGCISLFIFACSDTDSTKPIQAIEAVTSSETIISSSSKAQPTSSSAQKDTAFAPVEVTHDTIISKVEISSKEEYKDPYFSSGIFCWSKECETECNSEWNSSSSVAIESSSSISIEITMSQAAEPIVTETQMIDGRDQQVYTLMRIGTLHWTVNNMKYKANSGVYCEWENSDMCEKYGMFYTYAAAKNACPPNWRLPTTAEVEAADKIVEHEWWTIGGRFKLTEAYEIEEYGLEKDQGFIWLTSDGTNNSWRVKNYSGDTAHELQSGSEQRAYNVRCVSEK